MQVVIALQAQCVNSIITHYYQFVASPLLLRDVRFLSTNGRGYGL